MTTHGMHCAAARRGAVRDEARWKRWILGFGEHARRVREFLGLSQVQLARLAGISQGGVSRFESGRGLSTPLLVVARIHIALARGIAGLDPSVLSPEAQRLLRLVELLRLPADPDGPLPSADTGFERVALTAEPGLERLIRAYQGLPSRQRPNFLAVMEAAAAALAE